jgi:predicted MFS family arabinose efflux permease
VDRVNIKEAAAEPTPPPVLRKSPGSPDVSPTAILMLAAACGLLVANIYYAQPLIAEIAQSLGLAKGAAGLIVTMSQIGYGVGLLFVVPLGDLLENRRLILISVTLSAVALACAAFAPSAAVFLACAGVVGLGSVAVQILIPLAAHLASDATRGRVVGMVSSGLMIGIMMARPVSSFIAAQSSWRAVLALSAAAMVALAAFLSRSLPRRAPQTKMTYGELMGSMVHLVMATPVLRRRAFYQACLFFAFSLFWTTIPLLLAGPHYGLTQNGIALFALAGVSGAIAAPIGGRVADRGWGRQATGCAIAIVALAMLGSIVIPQGSTVALLLLVAIAIAIDFGCQANLVLGLSFSYSILGCTQGRNRRTPTALERQASRPRHGSNRPASFSSPTIIPLVSVSRKKCRERMSRCSVVKLGAIAT